MCLMRHFPLFFFREFFFARLGLGFCDARGGLPCGSLRFPCFLWHRFVVITGISGLVLRRIRFKIAEFGIVFGNNGLLMALRGFFAGDDSSAAASRGSFAVSLEGFARFVGVLEAEWLACRRFPGFLQLILLACQGSFGFARRVFPRLARFASGFVTYSLGRGTVSSRVKHIAAP